jgi:dsRNA-specific ribonuclease
MDSHSSINKLQEYLVKEKLPMPAYKQIGATGEPHDMTFFIECTVGPEVAIGDGKTKKQAKKNAASRVLQFLMASTASPADNPCEEPTPIRPRKKSSLSATQQMLSELKGQLANSQSEIITSVRESFMNNEDKVSQLKQICSSLNFKISYEVQEFDSESWQSLLEFSGPSTIFYLGFGLSKDQAKQNAAGAMLAMLVNML